MALMAVPREGSTSAAVSAQEPSPSFGRRQQLSKQKAELSDEWLQPCSFQEGVRAL